LLNELEAKSKEYGIQLAESITEPVIRAKGAAKRSARKKPSQPTTTGGITAGHVPENELAAISTGIDSCWAKLRKYYKLIDKSPVYAAAVVLNPQYKWDYFNTHWADHPEWIAQAQDSVEDLWRNMYANQQEEAEDDLEDGGNSSLFLPTPQKGISRFDQWVLSGRRAAPGVTKGDDYSQYLGAEELHNLRSKETPPSSQIKSVDLCAFWARYEAYYPSLARMAFDVLSIPAMSAECERVFSSAKLLLTDRRARMKEEIIEASECLRAWYLAGLIE